MSAQAGETWLLDLGNSRAKLARLGRGGPVDITALDWSRPDFVAALRARLDSWRRPRRILVASVAPAERSEVLRECLPRETSVEIEWLQSPRRACGVVNRYAKPERLGIDRFLSMVAVHARAQGAAVVVGCGTALTLDAVAADGGHPAGLIAPSPARMLEALQRDTAIAARNADAFRANAEDDTAVSLQAGCWAAAGALVEWFSKDQQAVFGEVTVWLHGGWGQALAAWLARDGCVAEVLEHAVLHGLAVWAEHLCDGP